MNTIRQLQFGELAGTKRSPGAETLQCAQAIVTEACVEDAAVVGGSGSGKDDVVNAGDLRAEDVRETGQSAGVRATIVASKPGNAGGAKGGRKANASSEGLGETQPPAVPTEDKQGGEDPWQRYGAERGVWSEKMLAALHREGEGNKWFSLIDKVGRLDVLELAWAKVHANAGACGVDGITVERFDKDSPRRLLAVKEQLERGDYQPQPVKPSLDPEARKRREATVGHPDGARPRCADCREDGH